jgi:hypothetical protein
MKESFLEFTDKLKIYWSLFFDGHPLRLYLLVMSLLTFYLFGLYFDWKWTAWYNPNSDSFWRIFLHENYDRKSIRIVYAISVIILMLSISAAFYLKYIK